MAVPALEECWVTTQPSRGVKRSRWAYVLHIPGWWPFVSHGRYGSEEAAQAAGERDLAETVQAMRDGEGA